jgi:uncharacterized protein
MLTLTDLKPVAHFKRLNLGQAEKDYLLELVLFSISRHTKDKLVFKGGTCLYKAYKLARFSEDIDFTAAKELNTETLTEQILADLKRFGVNAALHRKKQPFNSVLLTFRCEGPLYNGTPMTYASVRVDINLKSSIECEPALRNFTSHYTDVPPFTLLVMQEKEILAEKIRAILTRDKARDAYDLWYLLKHGVQAEHSLIEAKMAYYNQTFSISEFRSALERKKANWETELKRLVQLGLPSFEDAKKLIVTEAAKWA